MLHDARDIVPGVQELVDAHRAGRPGPVEVRRLTFAVVNRGYHLLLGLRRHRDWTTLRPRTFAASLVGLRGAFDAVVADIDADLEGEAECGSVDVEERNVMARTVIDHADAVVVVGTPGAKGLHGLIRTVGRLGDHGVAPDRILAVVNHSSRAVKARAETNRSFADLLGGAADATVVGPIHLFERRGLDEILRDGAPLPTSLTTPLGPALAHTLGGAGPRLAVGPERPVPVAPGSLGAWADQEIAG
jgi:hypothetical protein